MPLSIVVSDIDSASWTTLADELGSNFHLLLQPHKGEANLDCSLALNICAEGAEREKAFDIWARSRAIPALNVQIETHQIVIGPLSVPGMSGCGYCARARITAAFASKESIQRMPNTLSCVGPVVRSLLAAEIRAIYECGFGTSGLIRCVLICDPKSGMTSRHRVIPLPWCPVCGGASLIGAFANSESVLSIEEEPEILLRRLEGWVDSYTGIISCLQLEVPEDGKQVPIIATTSPPHILHDDGSLRRLPLGWGKGLGISEAILSAVGEAIERYSASLVDPARLTWKRCDELHGDFLDPRETALYSEAQYANAHFPFVRFDPNIEHPWILGTWGHDSTPVWVPAILVYLFFRGGPEHFFAQGTSNGLATSTTKQDAALRALFELVERDAFMTAWLTGTRGERIVLDEALDPELKEVIETVELLGANIELYRLPDCTLGTAVLCLALGDGVEYPGVTIGLSADLDPRRAVRQAILELAQTGPHLRRMMRSQRLRVPGTPQAVRDMLDHAAYYFPAGTVVAFERIRNDQAQLALRDMLLPTQTLERSIASCASALESTGIRVAIIDVTSPDLLISPFRVVRAVSPDLQPISYGYGLDFEPVHRVRRRGVSVDLPPIHPIW
jgi:ribosomal protein S12 methylthiotransferase accessory factor